jgi:hypothetical protein
MSEQIAAIEQQRELIEQLESEEDSLHRKWMEHGAEYGDRFRASGDALDEARDELARMEAELNG